jgi:prepilin-type processing-associated H-X9-DG protein
MRVMRVKSDLDSPESTRNLMRSIRRRSTGFSLIEFLVLVVIVGILIALLWPVMARARVKAQGAACVNQLKQWSVAFRMYADDNHGWLFTTKHWESTEFLVNGQKVRNVYARYLGDANSDKIIQLRNCPSAFRNASVTELKSENRYGYSMNWPNVRTPNGCHPSETDLYGGASYRMDKIPKPAEFLLLLDTDGSRFSVKSSELKEMVSSILERHSGGVNILWADQHVTLVSFDTIAAQSYLSDDQNTWFQAN